MTPLISLQITHFCTRRCPLRYQSYSTCLALHTPWLPVLHRQCARDPSKHWMLRQIRCRLQPSAGQCKRTRASRREQVSHANLHLLDTRSCNTGSEGKQRCLRTPAAPHRQVHKAIAMKVATDIAHTCTSMALHSAM